MCYETFGHGCLLQYHDTCHDNPLTTRPTASPTASSMASSTAISTASPTENSTASPQGDINGKPHEKIHGKPHGKVYGSIDGNPHDKIHGKPHGNIHGKPHGKIHGNPRGKCRGKLWHCSPPGPQEARPPPRSHPDLAPPTKCSYTGPPGALTPPGTDLTPHRVNSSPTGIRSG